jgi:hypothetical protein
LKRARTGGASAILASLWLQATRGRAQVHLIAFFASKATKGRARLAPSLHAETLNDEQIYFYINPLNNYNYGRKKEIRET